MPSTTLAASPEVQTRFDPKATLTPDEVHRVVALARRAGLSDIAEVSTYFSPWTNATMRISVKSREVLTGREVTFSTVAIDSEAWLGYYVLANASLSPRPPRSRSNDFASDGEFWVERGALTAHRYGTFNFGAESIRISLDGGITLSDANRIVAAYTTGKLRANKPELQSSPMHIWPTNVGRKGDGKTFVLGFYDTLSATSLECVLENEGVRVTDLQIAIF